MESAGAIPSTVKTLNYELRRSVAEPRAERVFPERFPGLASAGAGAVSAVDAGSVTRANAGNGVAHARTRSLVGLRAQMRPGYRCALRAAPAEHCAICTKLASSNSSRPHVSLAMPDSINSPQRVATRPGESLSPGAALVRSGSLGYGRYRLGADVDGAGDADDAGPGLLLRRVWCSARTCSPPSCTASSSWR